MKALTNTSPIAIVDLVDGHPVTYSHVIARQFSKSHKNVLQAIREISCSTEFSRLNFQPSSYIDERGKAQPSVTLTRDGCTRLILSFKGAKASDFAEMYIKRFNEMEETLKLLPGEVKIQANDLTVFQKYGRDLIAMQRRCLKQAGQIERFLRQQIRRMGLVPVKMPVPANQMELPL